MEILIKRIDTDLPLPEYHTEGAVGFDLIARITTRIPARSYALVPNNVIIKVPQGYMLGIVPRSSTLKKKGLMTGNAMGIIDQDYHGPEDEIHTLFFNPGNTDIMIERGERWSQAIFIKVETGQFIERSASLKEENRGGFGTTGERSA